MVPLDHTHATATFSITGLALGCYNLADSIYEVGFIRHPGHRFYITVIRNSLDGKDVHKFEVPANHRISIETEGGITPPQPPFHKPTLYFDRNASGQDPEDFRWIVDIEIELNNNQPVNLIKSPVPITEASISKPFLYADKEGPPLGRVNRVNLDNPIEVEPFGTLVETIKGDITCQDGGAVILKIEGPLGFNIPLPHLPGLPHGIVMNNTCPPRTRQPGEPGDFAFYYSLVERTGGKRFFFKPEEDDVLSPDSTCNGTNAGARGKLFPLPV